MNDRNIEVLDQYELELKSVRRGRGAWVCDTDQGLKLLREYKGTELRLAFEEEVLNILKEGGCHVDQYVRNREGQLQSTGQDGLRYIVKDWFAEKEWDLREERELLGAVEQIARLHSLLREIPVREEWNLGSILAEPMAQEMDRHNRELKRTRNFIRGKRKKSDFELCVIGNFDLFFHQALEASQGLKSMADQGRTPACYLCHGDLNQHHILKGASFIPVIEFNRMHLGVQASDLYQFIRKAMEKHSWNLSLGLKMLEAYSRILPMSGEEREYLYYLFLYPEKYWKQLNFYYNANKAWIPARNVEKLRNLERQQEERNLFLSRIRG